MTATVTGSGTATRAPARARQPAARRGLAFPRASTTPAKVRLIRSGSLTTLSADFQQDFRTAQGTFSSLLTRAGQRSTAGAAGSIAAARQDANSWFAVNQQAQKLDAAAGSGAFTSLEAGVPVLALIMAIGSARGLSRRLAEYR
jgi:hypothetical protein